MVQLQSLYLDYESCLLLAFGHITPSTSQAMSSLAKQRGTITLHAISNPVWTSCRHMPLPWLVKEACRDVADSHKISSTMLKRGLD